jgi:hypothetical protein
VLKKIPGFSGDTFLEIFVRMKLHCKKIGEDALANEVNQVRMANGVAGFVRFVMIHLFNQDLL